MVERTGWKVFVTDSPTQATEWLRETTDEMNMPFVNTVFSELTTLGFIGLLLFVVTKLDVLPGISRAYLGADDELQESIEMLHMGLFLFIIIFLVLCCALLKLGLVVQNEWREFERGSADIPAVVSEYVLSTEPPSSWHERLSLHRMLAARKARREMVYLALRRRFVDFRSNHPDADLALKLAKEFQVNPDVRFPFHEYLSIISGEVMGRMIAIDLPTWVALEFFLVVMVMACCAAGPEGEILLLLFAGLTLIALSEAIHIRVRRMRQLLTPPRLLKDAERLRRKNEWRARHRLPLIESTEKSWILETAETGEEDGTPPYVDLLPGGGRHLSEAELAEQQATLLGGGTGNGVALALFSTRLVFLLTAMHLAVFLIRGVRLISKHHHQWLDVIVLDALFVLPSVFVTSMSVRIARDGLYAFNIEHMKESRVIVKVMRLLRARQTLRTLRFVAEMKVYLRESARPRSPTATAASLPITASLHEASARYSTVVAKKTGWRAPSSPAASPPSSPKPPSPSRLQSAVALASKKIQGGPVSISAARRTSLSSVAALLTSAAKPPASQTSSSPPASPPPKSSPPVSPPLSPLAAYLSPREKRSDAYKLETERREIHTIFCLFDLDGSGSVSRDEMANLLTAITHELDESQLTRLMAELMAGSDSDDEITFEAFYNWCHQHIHENRHSKEELIEEIFRMVDADGSGFITVDEFVAIFKTLGQSLDHDDVRELVYQMDRNNDGKIDLEEFTKMLEKHEV